MLRAAYQSLLTAELPEEDRVRAGARIFFEFAVADSARLQLLLLPVIPAAFVHSVTSYALASEVLAELSKALRAVRIIDPAALDIWTAMLAGLATQLVSNDAGGSRWADVLDRTVDILLADSHLVRRDRRRSLTAPEHIRPTCYQEVVPELGAHPAEGLRCSVSCGGNRSR